MNAGTALTCPHPHARTAAMGGSTSALPLSAAGLLAACPLHGAHGPGAAASHLGCPSGSSAPSDSSLLLAQASGAGVCAGGEGAAGAAAAQLLPPQTPCKVHTCKARFVGRADTPIRPPSNATPGGAASQHALGLLPPAAPPPPFTHGGGAWGTEGLGHAGVQQQQGHPAPAAPAPPAPAAAGGGAAGDGAGADPAVQAIIQQCQRLVQGTLDDVAGLRWAGGARCCV